GSPAATQGRVLPVAPGYTSDIWGVGEGKKRRRQQQAQRNEQPPQGDPPSPASPARSAPGEEPAALPDADAPWAEFVAAWRKVLMCAGSPIKEPSFKSRMAHLHKTGSDLPVELLTEVNAQGLTGEAAWDYVQERRETLKLREQARQRDELRRAEACVNRMQSLGAIGSADVCANFVRRLSLECALTEEEIYSQVESAMSRASTAERTVTEVLWDIVKQKADAKEKADALD
ncbi:MAG: hypothetical protein ACT4P4_19515, partial [Betaproteobacteria bacterium]